MSPAVGMDPLRNAESERVFRGGREAKSKHVEDAFHNSDMATSRLSLIKKIESELGLKASGPSARDNAPHLSAISSLYSVCRA